VQSASVLDGESADCRSVADAKRAFAQLNEELFSQASVDTEAEIGGVSEFCLPLTCTSGMTGYEFRVWI
jgi:hypothetical protein